MTGPEPEAPLSRRELRALRERELAEQGEVEGPDATVFDRTLTVSEPVDAALAPVSDATADHDEPQALAAALGFEPDADAAPRTARRRASVVGVLGELLLTAGVVVLLFVAWQMWIGDIIMREEGNRESQLIAAEWNELPPPEAPLPIIDDDGEVVYEPVVAARPVGTADFGVMYVPRFGADYQAVLAGGTTRSGTLDRNRIGLYDDAAMPGEEGNFSLAGHRTTWGMPLRHIDSLRVGDAIIIETREGWYLYRFRTMEYVTPDRVQVLLDVPQVPGAQTGERYITLTSCSPLFSLAERIIAYGVFESFHPRAEGPPIWFEERNA